VRGEFAPNALQCQRAEARRIAAAAVASFLTAFFVFFGRYANGRQV
jgi:hypothetical protein